MIQRFKRFEQMKQNQICEGIDLAQNFSPRLPRWDVGFLIGLDDGLKQGIAEKQKGARRVGVVETETMGTRSVFVSDGMRFRSRIIAFGGEIINQSLKERTRALTILIAAPPDSVFDTRSGLRDVLLQFACGYCETRFGSRRSVRSSAECAAVCAHSSTSLLL